MWQWAWQQGEVGMAVIWGVRKTQNREWVWHGCGKGTTHTTPISLPHPLPSHCSTHSHLTATPTPISLPRPLISLPHPLPSHCHSHLTATPTHLTATPTPISLPHPLTVLCTWLSLQYLTTPIALSQVTECLTDHCNADISILLAELGSMINSPLLSDLTILTAQGTHINAHGCILAARCPGFREAVLEQEKPPQVLDLSGFPHKAVLAYLEHVYCASSSSDLDERTREQVEAVAAK